MAKAARDPVTGVTPQMELFACWMAKTGRPVIAHEKAYPGQMGTPGRNTEANRLLHDERVLARVEHYRRIAERALDTSVIAIARQMARIAFLDMRDCYDEQGRLLMPHELPTDIAMALDGIDVVEMAGAMKISVGAGNDDGDDEKPKKEKGEPPAEPAIVHVPMYTKKVRFNRVKALEMLARWRRMIQDKVDERSPSDLSQLTDEELDREYSAMQEAVAMIERSRKTKPKEKRAASKQE